MAEENHRPEPAAGADADHQFVSAVSGLHRLDRKAVDHRFGGQIPHPLQHFGGGHQHFERVFQVERHAADIGLVDDVRRENFQGHRPADFQHRVGGRLRRGGEAQRRDRNLVGAQDLAGFVGVQTAAAGGQRDLNDPAGGFDVGGEALRNRGRGLHQQFLIVPVLGEPQEGFHRFAGRFITG